MDTFEDETVFINFIDQYLNRDQGEGTNWQETRLALIPFGKLDEVTNT